MTSQTENEPQWFCADHGAPSPHYVGTRAPTDHVCTDSELAADPPAWSASSSAVTQSYWSCWDTGAPRQHHLGHDAPGDHLCSDRELAGPTS